MYVSTAGLSVFITRICVAAYWQQVNKREVTAHAGEKEEGLLQ